jgi:hypothetical protein
MRFETDIKPLFREADQRSMQPWFDLWSYDDVLDHAQDVLNESKTGRCPAMSHGRRERSKRYAPGSNRDVSPERTDTECRQTQSRPGIAS